MSEHARRPVGRWILAGLFLALSLNALVQFVMHLLHMNSDPPALAVLQLLTGTAAFIAARTTWHASPRAWVWSLVYGAIQAVLLISLGPILDLEREAMPGLWMGAGVMAAFAIGSAWYLRRIAPSNSS